VSTRAGHWTSSEHTHTLLYWGNFLDKRLHGRLERVNILSELREERLWSRMDWTSSDGFQLLGMLEVLTRSPLRTRYIVLKMSFASGEKTCPAISQLIKVKIQFFLCFNWAPRHEHVLGERSYSSSSSALDGGEWSASRPGRFTPRERAPCTNWIGGWVGSRASLDAVVKRKIPSSCRNSNP